MEIKEVGPSDYDAVMAIRQPEDVYDGLDYLPDHFMSLINIPGYKGYVVQFEGKFIAFSFAVCLDDGKTLVTRAGRVSKDWEGKGIYKMLQTYIMDKYKTNKDLQYNAVSFSADNHKMMKGLIDGNLHQIAKKKVIGYRSTMAAIKQLINRRTNDINQIYRLTGQDFEDLLSSKSNCRSIFPDDRIVANWVPYRLTKTNIPFIMSKHCIIFGSNLKSSDRLLSIGEIEVCKKCLVYHIDVYGEINAGLAGHIFQHLGTISDKYDTEVVFSFYIYEGNKNEDMFEQVLKGFRFEQCEVFSSQLIVAESLIDSKVSEWKKQNC